MKKNVILLVKDKDIAEREFNDLIKFLENDHEVISAFSLGEAKEVLSERNIDILIAAQNMSRDMGIKLISYCKTNYPLIVRILVADTLDFGIVVEALNSSLIFHFLTIPWNIENVTNVLRQASYYVKLQKTDEDLEVDQDEVERLKKAIHDLNNDVINALMAFIKVKDYELYKHCYNVSRIAAILGKKLNLSDEVIYNLRIAGMLHDIGKVAIKDAILNKPSKLDTDEFQIMKEHPLKGYMVVNEIGFMNEIANIVYQHHERMDGKGYPNSLNGDKILIEAKIIAVADAYDALISNRIYRVGMDTESALEIIRTESGHYDENIVEVLINYCNEENAESLV